MPQSEPLLDATTSNVRDSNLDEAIDLIWQFVSTSDADPHVSHIELLIGSGERPWDGDRQRNVHYYLTSQSVNYLTLLTFNDCLTLCSDAFPDCFRIVDDPHVDSIADAVDDAVEESTNLADQAPTRVRKRCGRRFAKSARGVREALLFARAVHSQSLARKRPQWAVLVQYDRQGQHRRLATWNTLDDLFVGVGTRKGVTKWRDECTRSVRLVPLFIVVGLFSLLLLSALLVTLVSNWNAYYHSARSLADETNSSVEQYERSDVQRKRQDARLERLRFARLPR